MALGPRKSIHHLPVTLHTDNHLPAADGSGRTEAY